MAQLSTEARPASVKVDEKRCPQCKQTKTWNAFYNSKNSPNGLSSWCKVCKTAAPDAVESKMCPTCKEIKPAIDFALNRTTSDGLQKSCRSCMRQYWRKDYKPAKEAPDKTTTAVVQASPTLPPTLPPAVRQMLFGMSISESEGESLDPKTAARIELARQMIGVYGEIIQELIR